MTTEAWKTERYQELAFEVRRIQQVEVLVEPLVIGALGTVSKDFVKWQLVCSCTNKIKLIHIKSYWFLRRGENRSTRRKTLWSRVENQQTQPTYDAGSGNPTTLTQG